MKVSIIIPAYNAEAYLRKCIHQIEHQTEKDFEVIIINDGSTDNTEKKLKKYAAKYNYIKVINQENSGQAVARNKAEKMAVGEYITFVDVDDFIDNTFIEEMYNIAQETKADIVYCDYYEYYNPDKMNLVKNDKNKILANYAPWGKLYKKSFYDKTKLQFLEGKLFEDIVIVPVLAGLGKCTYLPLPLYYYNKSNVSAIRRDKYNSSLEDIFDSMDETIYNFKKHKIFNKYRDEIEFIYLDSFLRGAVLRFADFREGIKYIPKVREKVLNYFPNILENKYYLESSKKDKKIYKMCLNMNPRLLSFFKRTYKKVK